MSLEARTFGAFRSICKKLQACFRARGMLPSYSSSKSEINQRHSESKSFPAATPSYEGYSGVHLLIPIHSV